MVRWRVLENENPVIQKAPNLSDLGNSGTYKKSSLDIIYSLDELGRFNEIENWQEVEKFWDLKLHEQVNTKGVNTAKSDSVFDVIKSAFRTKAMIESSVTKDIMALHIYNGISYKPELQVDTVILVGLENSPMPSIVTTQIFEENDSYFALQTTQKMFPENLANQMGSFLEKFTNDDENELPEVFMTDTCYSNFFTNDSIPYAVNYWRTVKLGDKNKLVQISLTREFGMSDWSW